MRQKWGRVWAALAAAVLVVGCGLPPESPSNRDAGASPPDAATARRLAAAANALGFEVLAGLTDEGRGPAGQSPGNGSGAENVAVSPLSLATVLTMLLHGADGETAAAIAEVLHLEGPGDAAAREGFAGLVQALSRTEAGVELAVANSVWTQKGYPVQPAYLQEMEQTFAAEIREVDLGNRRAAAAIDDWVAEQTRGRIEEMARALGLPSSDLVMILLNAVYFQGEWTDPFNASFTRPGRFVRPDGREVQVPFMSRSGSYPFAQGEGFQVLRLPYGPEGRFGMEIFLPDPGRTLADLQGRLDAAAWAEAAAQLEPRHLQVNLPRFELAYHARDLDRVLRELGMGVAYTPDSDFTRLSPADPWVSTVQQKTSIKVDEKGTEAAAVTGAAPAGSARPLEFRVDRPFLFTISDAETGAILFLGQVTDPSEQG